MSDIFSDYRKGLDSPADKHFQITPSDTTDLEFQPRALYVNTAGTASLVDADGAVVSYNVLEGAVLTMRPVRVNSTGTTADLIGWL